MWRKKMTSHQEQHRGPFSYSPVPLLHRRKSRGRIESNDDPSTTSLWEGDEQHRFSKTFSPSLNPVSSFSSPFRSPVLPTLATTAPSPLLRTRRPRQFVPPGPPWICAVISFFLGFGSCFVCDAYLIFVLIQNRIDKRETAGEEDGIAEEAVRSGTHWGWIYLVVALSLQLFVLGMTCWGFFAVAFSNPGVVPKDLWSEMPIPAGPLGIPPSAINFYKREMEGKRLREEGNVHRIAHFLGSAPLSPSPSPIHHESSHGERALLPALSCPSEQTRVFATLEEEWNRSLEVKQGGDKEKEEVEVREEMRKMMMEMMGPTLVMEDGRTTLSFGWNPSEERLVPSGNNGLGTFPAPVFPSSAIVGVPPPPPPPPLPLSFLSASTVPGEEERTHGADSGISQSSSRRRTGGDGEGEGGENSSAEEETRKTEEWNGKAKRKSGLPSSSSPLPALPYFLPSIDAWPSRNKHFVLQRELRPTHPLAPPPPAPLLPPVPPPPPPPPPHRSSMMSMEDINKKNRMGNGEEDAKREGEKTVAKHKKMMATTTTTTTRPPTPTLSTSTPMRMSPDEGQGGEEDEDREENSMEREANSYETTRAEDREVGREGEAGREALLCDLRNDHSTHDLYAYPVLPPPSSFCTPPGIIFPSPPSPSLAVSPLPQTPPPLPPPRSQSPHYVDPPSLPPPSPTIPIASDTTASVKTTPMPYPTDLSSTPEFRFCLPCQIYKPDYARHCNFCDRCVYFFDHHCPFVNNCIGRNNYRMFYTFVLYGSLCGIHAPLTLVALFSLDSRPWTKNKAWMIPPLVALILWLFVFVLCNVHSFLIHYSLQTVDASIMINNGITVCHVDEYFNLFKLDPKKRRREYRRGVFGLHHRWWKFLFPTSIRSDNDADYFT